jgi:outer membrane lipase/esterase
MKMSKRILPSVLASLFLGAAAAGAQAQQFSQVVVFGDSLSDAGYFRPFLGTLGLPASLVSTLGRFTTNPGPVWSELMTTHYGLVPNPSNAGGSIYAQGGARVALDSASTPPGSAQRPVSTQITEYLAARNGTADPRALFTVWAGANDFLQNFTLLSAGQITPAQLQTNVLGAVTAEIGQVGRLYQAGARNVMLFLNYDPSATPQFAAADAVTRGSATQLAVGANTTALTTLAGAGLRPIVADIFSLMNELKANPSAYGFSNSTGIACGPFPPITTSGNSQFCYSGNLVAANADKTYIFADSIHPTSATHAIFAQFAEALIDGPYAYSLLAEVPLSTRNGHVRALNEGLGQGERVDVGDYSVFAAGDRGDFDIDSATAFAGVKSTNSSATVGITARASEEVTLGAAFGMSKNDASFGGSSGGFRTLERVGSLFASYKWRGLYGTAVGSIGNISFGNVSRNISLGSLTRAASASTGGSNMSAAFTAGYDFRIGRFTIGPTVGVISQNVTVNNFDESNAGSSNLHIGDQSRKSQVWSGGLRASVDVGSWTPWLRVTADKERTDSARLVTAMPLTLTPTGNSYDIQAYAPDTNFVTSSVGLRGTIMRTVGVAVAYTRVSSREGIKEDGVSAMLSMRF